VDNWDKTIKKTRLKMSISKTGNKHWNWKGGRTSQGKYVRIKNRSHPNSNMLGYVYEHRLIIEKYLGRLLKRKETVHHINKNRKDNRLENLMLFTEDKFHKKYECNKPIPKKAIIFDGRKWRKNVQNEHVK
jgi:hypothetical protein